jgi:hypothetical protein
MSADEEEEFRRAFLLEIGEDDEVESRKPKSVFALLNSHARSAVGDTAPPRSSLLRALEKAKPLQVRALFCLVFRVYISHDLLWQDLGGKMPKPQSHQATIRSPRRDEVIQLLDTVTESAQNTNMIRKKDSSQVHASSWFHAATSL